MGPDFQTVDRFMRMSPLRETIRNVQPYSAELLTQGGFQASSFVNTLAELGDQVVMYVQVRDEARRALLEAGFGGAASTGVDFVSFIQSGISEQWQVLEAGAKATVLNPAILANLSTMMTQMALHQSLSQITRYVESIDKKLVRILQKVDDSQIAQLHGTRRDLAWLWGHFWANGEVEPSTEGVLPLYQSKLSDVMSYALSQLEHAGHEIVESSDIKGLSAALSQGHADAQKWLAVLALCQEAEHQMDFLRLQANPESEQLSMPLVGQPRSRIARRQAEFQIASNRFLRSVVEAVRKAQRKVHFRAQMTREVNKRIHTIFYLFEHLAFMMSFDLDRRHAEDLKVLGGIDLLAHKFKSTMAQLTNSSRQHNQPTYYRAPTQFVGNPGAQRLQGQPMWQPPQFPPPVQAMAIQQPPQHLIPQPQPPRPEPQLQEPDPPQEPEPPQEPRWKVPPHVRPTTRP